MRGKHVLTADLTLQPHPRLISVREFDAAGFQRGADGANGSGTDDDSKDCYSRMGQVGFWCCQVVAAPIKNTVKGVR